MHELHNNNNNNNNNNDFITVFPLKGGSSSVKFTTILKNKIMTIVILIILHWLPVKYRIHFKILLLQAFKSLNGMAPVYISDFINVRKHANYSLRSNSGPILLPPAGKMKKSFGGRSFSVAAPSLRNIDSILTFKSCLKPYLFKLVFSL